VAPSLLASCDSRSARKSRSGHSPRTHTDRQYLPSRPTDPPQLYAAAISDRTPSSAACRMGRPSRKPRPALAPWTQLRRLARLRGAGYRVAGRPPLHLRVADFRTGKKIGEYGWSGLGIETVQAERRAPAGAVGAGRVDFPSAIRRSFIVLTRFPSSIKLNRMVPDAPAQLGIKSPRRVRYSGLPRSSLWDVLRSRATRCFSR